MTRQKNPLRRDDFAGQHGSRAERASVYIAQNHLTPEEVIEETKKASHTSYRVGIWIGNNEDATVYGFAFPCAQAHRQGRRVAPYKYAQDVRDTFYLVTDGSGAYPKMPNAYVPCIERMLLCDHPEWEIKLEPSMFDLIEVEPASRYIKREEALIDYLQL